MTKEDYIRVRHNLNTCFELYCNINNLRPTAQEVNFIGQHISANKLRYWLDGHFKVTILQNQKGQIIKAF